VAVVLIGFMGAGKSTAAKQLAEALQVPCRDTDELLEGRLGHTVAQEFATSGEAAFRELEQQVVLETLAAAGAGLDAVVALGGGSVLSERVREALRGHLTVLLDVSPQEAWRRVQGTEGAADRPLASDWERFQDLHAGRAQLYERLADAVLVGLAEGALAGVADGLVMLAGAPAGTRLLWACSDSGQYPVLIGEGLMSRLGDGGLWPLPRSRSRPFLVSDRSVAALYGERLGELALRIEIEPGEQSKTLATAEHVWETLAGAGMTRADHLVGLGGGVVGDLAGFCAATYQRGVPVVHVPTSLVAQVDSAYGGKTGVDLPQAKNYVGAYHQPAGVLVDLATLATLPEQELAAGWVEVLKTALIAGGALWERVEAGGEVDTWTVFACAATKLKTVAADERDGGRRQLLNLGHTVGHAIETATGYGRYRHGEAVGLGLLAALRLSGQQQLREDVEGLLAARGLPVVLQDADVDAVLDALHRDKKRIGADVPFVLVQAPGEVSWGQQVPAQDVRAAVSELIA
jgi:shikimate kinase/3-dehydroquinate synthase